MNNQLAEFARNQLKSDLQDCTQEQQLLFKRMYSHKDLEKPIDRVVDDMPDSNLDRALTQVQRTLEKKHDSNKKTT